MSNDFISRDAAIEAAFRVMVYNFGAIEEDKELFTKEMNAIPAADVAPVVHAKRVFIADEDGAGLYYCSRCNAPLLGFSRKKAPYCRCGAKMDGDENHAE